MSFQSQTLAGLAESGWARCPSVAKAVADAGLAPVSIPYLAEVISERQWQEAEQLTAAMGEHFREARFAGEARFGVVLVPDPARFDTRGALDPAVRHDQLGMRIDDAFDERMPEGVLGIPAGRDWTPVVTVTGHYGISAGSYHQVRSAPDEAFTVLGHDTRTLMIRQVWGARVLQGGADLPDSEANHHWTFTLFPGEPLTDGNAESGTVLKGRIRFRLGRPDRGIGPARVAPAVAVL
jgi:hypothetical protein